MKRVKHIKPVVFTVLLVTALFSPACGTPASAQDEFKFLVGLWDFRVAPFSGFPVYSLSGPLSRVISPDFDFVISDSFQPTPGGFTGNLLDVGIWYYPSGHVSGRNAISLRAGFVSEHGPFPGFGFANTSGYSIGAGAGIQLNEQPKLFVYASGSIVSLGGTSNSVVDLGLLLGDIELGYISFAGSGAPYLGLILPPF